MDMYIKTKKIKSKAITFTERRRFFTFWAILAYCVPFSSCGELKKNLTETKFVAQRQKRLNIIFKFLGHSKLISLEKNFNVI